MSHSCRFKKSQACFRWKMEEETDTAVAKKAAEDEIARALKIRINSPRPMGNKFHIQRTHK